VPVAEEAAGRLEKAMSQETNMHAGGESDGCVLPTKCSNKGGKPPAESMEGRQPAKENIGQATAPRTQSRTSELSDLHGVRKAAHKDKRMRFTALLHHVTINQSATGQLLRPEARCCAWGGWCDVEGTRNGPG